MIKWQPPGFGSRRCYENVAAFGWSWGGASCWRRCDTWGQRPSIHHVSRQFESGFVSIFRSLSTNKSFLSAVFPRSAGERQASHKKIKDCEMTESRFFAFARLLSIEPFSKTAAIIPWAEKSRQVLENQDGKKKNQKKKQQSRKTLRQSCNLTEWAINHHFSQQLVYYFTVFHLWKSNYCYLSVKASGQTSAGNVILSNDAFIKQFKFSV